NLFQPAIGVDKTGDDLSKVGDPINYTITLSNTSSGDTPNMECTATDSVLGILFDGVLPLGDTVLNPSYTVQAGDPDPFINTVELVCSPAGFPNVLRASDDHVTNLFQPSLEMNKSAWIYSKVGDDITYTVEIINTSSADSPVLNLAAFSDTLVTSLGAIDLPGTCQTLVAGDSCSFQYTYTVTEADDSGEPGAQLVNVASALYHPEGFPNDITASASHSATLFHPSFELYKDCSAEPISQDGPAVYNVRFVNTGDVDLMVAFDEDSEATGGALAAGVPYQVAANSEEIFVVTVAGDFAGVPSVSNTINATVTLPAWTELSNTYYGEATGVCEVASRTKVKKLTMGMVDPGQAWNFALYNGPNAGNNDAFVGSPIASSSVNGDADGILDFGYLDLDPSGTYTVCETNSLVTWHSNWIVDSNGDGVIDGLDMAITAYNPSSNNDPSEDLGYRCVDFGAGTSYPLTAGGTLLFQVDNISPGGDARTPGYWKNWNRCSNGNQAETSDNHGGWSEGYWLVEDALAITDPPGVTWGEFTINDCETAVAVLNAENLVTGKNSSRDPLYKLARHLLATELNFRAGTYECTLAYNAAIEAADLLASYDFDGTKTSYMKNKDPNFAYAQALGEILDRYNNNDYSLPCDQTVDAYVEAYMAKIAPSDGTEGGGGGGGGCFIQSLGLGN
ncbi:MAG: hypothetical protein C0608_01085, partial [Deltaproteobacteria bacterium]